MRTTLSLIVALGVLLAATGCARKKSEEPTATPAPPPAAEAKAVEPVTITVLCGGSFRPPMEEIAQGYEDATGNTIELSFGQSEDLLPQIQIGKEGDVFVSHDPFLDNVKEADALADSVQVGYVAPVLVVRKGNPAGMASLDDLASDGVKVAIPNQDFSTCGKMLKRLLEKKGIWDAVFANADGAVFRSHSEIGNALKLGTRDAGVMWNGTAHEYPEDIEVVPTPYEYDETIQVHIMALSYTDTREATEDFLHYCDEKAADVFAAYGYTK